MNSGRSHQSPPLDALLAALPREVVPARDLWPGVAALIAPASRPAAVHRRWPLAFAASVSVATAIGLIVWQAGRQPPPAAEDATTSAIRPALVEDAGFALPGGGKYLATRAGLEQTYRERLALLPPKTRLRVEEDLATIRAANDDIRKALAADPQSPVLNRLLEGIWQQEFDLYVTVARNTDPAVRRTRS
jgi:hypothetical protein